MTPPTSTEGLDEALAEAAGALQTDVGRAASLSREILMRTPSDPRARLVLGAALRRLGDLDAARAVLEPLAHSQPRSAPAHRELGLALAASANDAAAVVSLHHAVRLQPASVDTWRALAASLARLGDAGGAEGALRLCLGHSPSSREAAYDLATLLHRRQADDEAFGLAATLVANSPEEMAYRTLLAACAAAVGDYDRAVELYRALLDEYPDEPALWLSLGHALRALGDRAAAVAAYRRRLALPGPVGEAYWSLASLKDSSLSPGDEAVLCARIASGGSDANERLHLQYALGRALEQAGRFEDSFHSYAAGAAIGRALRPFDADRSEAALAAAQDAFTPEVFERSAVERPDIAPFDPAPIFIVGLPRVGSTLIEQILASHSQVEGCGELPTMMTIARELAAGSNGRYPASVAMLATSQLAAIGERYMTGTRIYRRGRRLRFVDKMPNNFHHLGLIRLALPNAKIIDARRAPMAAGFSLFKQHFAAGHAFSYDLRDIGRYYRSYVAMMAHYDAVLPGAVLRVDYEALVRDTEAEVRRLLDFCGLPYEQACLAFHANPRAVRTASSEQVRKPIFNEGLEHWRNFEPWLDPLREALGELA